MLVVRFVVNVAIKIQKQKTYLLENGFAINVENTMIEMKMQVIIY